MCLYNIDKTKEDIDNSKTLFKSAQITPEAKKVKIQSLSNQHSETPEKESGRYV